MLQKHATLLDGPKCNKNNALYVFSNTGQPLGCQSGFAQTDQRHIIRKGPSDATTVEFDNFQGGPLGTQKSHWVPPGGHVSFQRYVFDVFFSGPIFSLNMVPNTDSKSYALWTAQCG